jgi:hypothetical protein
MGRRIAAAVLVPLLLMAGVASAAARYRCRMDGTVRRNCCCPDEDTKADQAAPDQGQTFAPQGCCAMERLPREQAPASTAPRLSADALVALAVLLPAAPQALVPARRDTLGATERDRGVGPPLIALKSSRLF